MQLTTERLCLRPWALTDAADFAAMNADPEVMADLGGPLTRPASDRKLDRFRRSFETDGITRWVVTDRHGHFFGYCGIVVQREADHPLAVHHEIGWRFARSRWGHGYATEAASAALTDAFDRIGCHQVLAYTAADNLRSQRVMHKLGLERRSELDFTRHYDEVGQWQALVWSASRISPG